MAGARAAGERVAFCGANAQTAQISAGRPADPRI